MRPATHKQRALDSTLRYEDEGETKTPSKAERFRGAMRAIRDDVRTLAETSDPEFMKIIASIHEIQKQVEDLSHLE